MAAAAGSGSVVGVEFTDDKIDEAKSALSDASFSSAKLAVLRTLCQSYVFTTKQVAALLEEVSMSSDKMEALDVFESRIRDPSNTDPIAEVFSMSSDKEEAAAKVSGFSAARTGRLASYPIEDDGLRSDAEMAELLDAIEAGFMGSDKVAALDASVKAKPTPPFTVPQLMDVLGKFTFSSDLEAALELLVGPGLVYPMTCEELVGVLETQSMSDDKIRILPSLKRFIKDPQNKLTIVMSFSFSSDKEKAEEILRDVVAKFEPPNKPPPEVLEVLARLGNCPAGYSWCRVPMGWRCAAGGHYVSDERVEANL
ncbi:hypothetical protein FNF29_07559 [Cafeteria roenbergensis]|uniref:DUF4476 domain-containing protein n=1 Tax=Cafeteria roenbergensis TaxID=33653 RepID=A0A5A8C3E8_CAFRO|nr:hypothetical protein FNF29_07559 [Cafeteria roenbergensis]|eukprot:KAA0147187.1 hypothetical protein FNF29_07559 [Cafeteria roenbergensis]